MNRLAIKNLTVAYENKKVIDKLNINIKESKLTVLLGPSGCGKSTLLSAISGLIVPSEGSIEYRQRELYCRDNKTNIPVEKRNIGYVFQNYALWPHMTVYDNIAYPLKVKKINKQDIREKVNNILNIVGLSDREKSYPGQLSGGEKQRVAFARAIVLEPDILLLDEPLANLDANLKKHLLSQIKKIQQELQTTMIYVTHDQSEAFEIADEIVVMNEGKVMQKGTSKLLYNNPKNYFVASFIGHNNIIKKCDYHKHCFCKKMCKDYDNKAVGVRPEDIIINSKGKYNGTIIKSIFSGSNIHYIIKTDGIELLANGNINDEFELWDDIRYDIKKYHVIN